MSDVSTNAMVLAVINEALSKAIAKRPVGNCFIQGRLSCPWCGADLDYKEKHCYCSKCGQKLNWIDVDYE